MIIKTFNPLALHLRAPRIVIYNTLKIRYNFCKLPKPSRFAQQLGLQSKFQKVTILTNKNQKSRSAVFQMIMWGTICVVGSLFMGALASPQLRSKIYLAFNYAKAKIYKNKIQTIYPILLEIRNHQKQFYSNRKFTDQVSPKIIQSYFNMLQCCEDQQLEQKYEEILMEVLTLNLKNCNNSNRYPVYNKFLQKLLIKKIIIRQSQSLNKIISHLIQNSNIQTLYLIIRLSENNQLILSQAEKSKVKQKLKAQKLQIEEYKEKIMKSAQLKSQLLIQPYIYDCEMRKNWATYIENHL